MCGSGAQGILIYLPLRSARRDEAEGLWSCGHATRRARSGNAYLITATGDYAPLFTRLAGSLMARFMRGGGSSAIPEFICIAINPLTRAPFGIDLSPRIAGAP